MSHKTLKTELDARVVRSREAILVAAEHLLTTGGIEAVNHSSVALQAQVGRATVYRHWPRQIDLLLETFEKTTMPVFDFGDRHVRDEVVEQLTRRLPWFNQPAAGALIGTVIGRAEFEPEMEEMRSVLFNRSIATLVAELEVARARGDLRPDAIPETLATLIMGAVLFSRHMLGKTLHESDMRAIVDSTLTGWITERPSPS